MSPRFFLGRSGSLLVITLWLVTILSVLAVAIARYLSTEVRLTKYQLAREQAKTLARSGIFLAMERLKRDPTKDYDWLGDDWAVFPKGDPNDPTAWVLSVPTDRDDPNAASHELRVHILDAERKLDLNQPATSAKLESILGSPQLAQAVVDYLDVDTAGETRNDNPPYDQKNGPAVTLEELLEIPGMTSMSLAALGRDTFAVPEATPITTVNINTARPEVLKLVGLSDSAVALLEQFRAKADGFFSEAGLVITNTLKDRESVDLTGTPDGNLLTGSTIRVSSNTFTVTSEASLAQPALHYCIEAVIQREDCKAGIPKPCIVAWREPPLWTCHAS